MAFSFKGNTASLAISAGLDSPKIINNFSLVPKSGSAVVNVYLISGIYNISIMPNNYNINANDMYLQNRAIVVLANEQIKVQVSGSVDYDFNMDDMIIPNAQ